ncbi:MAG TPA: FAD-dependent oxidoreductase [Frankiaceae bacterium]|nr:FAD-dependent oxidoreductase [Frankiaceae bacterium]
MRSDRGSRQCLCVVGGGVTGLAAGAVSGAPVFEQSDGPGGICRSYYMKAFSPDRTGRAPSDDEAYRFEVGGGHWIFGSDPAVLDVIRELVPLTEYQRRAAVYIGRLGKTVPYPLQAHVGLLGGDLGQRAGAEWRELQDESKEPTTLREWLQLSFGTTLCELFFFPFNDRYTAGLSDSIAPQDAYKSPAFTPTQSAGQSSGYNAGFRYPEGGLDRLAAALEARCDVRYGKRLSRIATQERLLVFDDGSEQPYETVLCTVALHEAIELAGLVVPETPDPHTSVLVLNIGAERGRECPDVHWQYEPDSRAGFHRIGFYSNVDAGFLPARYRATGGAVSLYVERAYPAGQRPSNEEIACYQREVVAELQERDYLGEVHVIDPSWVEVAYTWRYPGSGWRTQAIEALAAHGIHQVGRYGTWHFQGIADSIRDGYAAGRRLHGSA